MFFAERPVALVSVYLIRQDTFGIMAEPLPVFLDNPLKFGRFSFVVGIERETVEEGISVDNADRDLCAEFCWSL